MKYGEMYSSWCRIQTATYYQRRFRLTSPVLLLLSIVRYWEYAFREEEIDGVEHVMSGVAWGVQTLISESLV